MAIEFNYNTKVDNINIEIGANYEAFYEVDFDITGIEVISKIYDTETEQIVEQFNCAIVDSNNFQIYLNKEQTSQLKAGEYLYSIHLKSGENISNAILDGKCFVKKSASL